MVSHHFGGLLTSLKKYRAIWDIALVAQPLDTPYRAKGHRYTYLGIAPMFFRYRRVSRYTGRRTTLQQLTCKIDLSNSFYYLFFSFVLIELKPFVLKGKVPGEKL